MELRDVTARLPGSPARAPSPGTRVEAVTTMAGLSELGPAWDELLSDSPSDCLFLTWEWLDAFARHLGDGRPLHVLLVRRGGRLEAIAPCRVARAGLLRPLVPTTLELLGTGTVGSDYLDVIVRRGSEASSHEAIAKYLSERRWGLALRQLATGASAEGVASALERAGYATLRRTTHVCPHADLTGMTWESYVASLGGSHRENLRRRLRKLHERFDVSFDAVFREDEVPAALDELLRLHELRWRDRGGSDAFDSPAVLAFHRELTARAFRRGWLRLFVLRLDGRPVAALYGFHHRGRFLYYQSGFDPEYASHAVAMVTLGLSIRAAIAEGAREIDLLHGDEPYKSLWARASRRLVSIDAYPPSPSGVLRRRLDGAERRARTALRRHLPRRSPPHGLGGAP